MKLPRLNRSMAMVVLSTMSSLSPFGNAAHSSTSNSAHSVSGAQTIPPSNKGATECARDTLSWPARRPPGEYIVTGMLILLSSCCKGVPVALASISTLSGCQ